MKSFWKKTGLLGCLVIFSTLYTLAQCSNTLQSITYDTLVSGTGNDTRVFTLPQLNPTLGTLVYVKINSKVSLNYGFTLQNTNATAVDYSISVGRYDKYSGTSFSPAYTNLTTPSLGSYLLNPGSSVTQAPSTILYRYLNSDSIAGAVAPFLGTGTLDFNYKSITYTNLTGSSLYDYSVLVNDTVDFSITYFYCNTSTLSTAIMDFTANVSANHRVDLAWVNVNEEPGSQSEIQKSSDGTNFEAISTLEDPGSVIQNNSYHYPYSITGEDGNKLFFRIKLVGKNQFVQYSQTREVDLGKGSGPFILYPNPSEDYINIAFNQEAHKNWRLDIFTANGDLLQSQYSSNSSLVHIEFSRKLAAGVYFMKATDQQTLQSAVLTFMVR